MYPNNQRSFFLPKQQQAWRIISCVGKYDTDPTGHSDFMQNGRLNPPHEMICFPSGEYREGAPQNYGAVINIFEHVVFGAITTYVITEKQVLQYHSHEKELVAVYELPAPYAIVGKIAGDTEEHRYFVATKSKGHPIGILFLRGDEWVLVEIGDETLKDFAPAHFAPSYQENTPSIITFASCNGELRQYLLDEICTSLQRKEQLTEEVVLLEPVG